MTLNNEKAIIKTLNLGDSIDEIENDQFLSSDEDADDSELLYWKSCANYIEDLPWFHGDMTRNTSEALLLANGVEGTYLVRNSASDPGSYTVSVRCQSSIKHYSLRHNVHDNTYTFGRGFYDSYNDLIDHFECKPVLTGETGEPVIFRYPYIKDVPEPSSYEKVLRHAEEGKEEINYTINIQELTDYHIASKEGYLIKRGALHKNWKKRWFVLHKNILRYYANKDDTNPIRMIDIRHAYIAVETECDNRRCISLVLPFRTFYFHAPTWHDSLSWFDILQWKINYYKKRMNIERENTMNREARDPESFVRV
ncbi:dual adapter for phosphotyrosine and 3-phosphotyrosine and 3-phosphoinositide isoform X1 [Hydra vulgaris]|uniref:dual adapter for phosphotyrosine and 3-phosphotyrosine and 3-phosphoinositide isoform X1 n=1 Tax=Hydra vulgaris TaxID=6087 RepID=UPI001F5FC3EB|nr:dual adapter for phosphotyrosine and 3-phosphotyrosine and 3-phosphoinositide [Hydra vulgaris]